MSHGFMDGTGITPGSEKCLCDNECEFPCWQRIGIGPACPSCGCPPFHDVTCTDGDCDQCRQTERDTENGDPDVGGYCDRECG